MRKYFAIIGIAATALRVSPAMASDLAIGLSYKDAPELTSSWTGCYAGGNLGVGFARNETIDAEAVPGLDVGSNAGAGGAGGAQLGCDYQRERWVFGIRGMFDWTGLKGSNNPSSQAIATTLVTYGASEVLTHQTQWTSSLIGRIGYEVQPGWLAYAAGGVAWLRNRYTDIDPVNQFAGAASETRSGWTAGGGVEYKFGRNWSAFAEYDYIGLGSRDVTLSYTAVIYPSSTYTFSIKEDRQMLLFGVNYRIGS
jgi:outer membrane immunogenic protein